MLQRRASGWTLCVLGLVIANALPASAQNSPQARVVGFPVKVGDATRLDPTSTAALGERVSIRMEAWPQCDHPGTPASQTSAITSQPASPGENRGANQTGNQKNNLPDGDQPSWIPGLTHAQILKLIPYLDARPLKGLYPETVDPESHTLTFHLVRTPASREAWTDLLSNPRFKPKVMSFSVGPEDKQQYPTCAKVSLVVIQVKWFLLAIVLFVILLYITFRLAAATALLRDPGISQGYIPGLSILWRRQRATTNLGPFSLARAQMAFWFFMVITAFVLIWMITGDTDTITESVLVLLGISAGTALGATVIDSSKRDTATRPIPGQGSRGFLNDVLSDGSGLSFHRFQIFVWTIVLGFVFFKNVLGHLAMPEFGANLLTLMGISSGTYLGLKLPEQQAPESPPPGAAQTNPVAPAPARDQQARQNNNQTTNVQESDPDDAGQD